MTVIADIIFRHMSAIREQEEFVCFGVFSLGNKIILMQLLCRTISSSLYTKLTGRHFFNL